MATVKKLAPVVVAALVAVAAAYGLDLQSAVCGPDSAPARAASDAGAP